MKLETLQPKNVVFFDLETTGLYHTDPDILQISAILGDSSDSFDKFLLPTKKGRTDPDAEKVNRLRYNSSDSMLWKIVDENNKRKCQAEQPNQALTKFVLWINRHFLGIVHKFFRLLTLRFIFFFENTF